jgi:hypothetical protein
LIEFSIDYFGAGSLAVGAGEDRALDADWRTYGEAKERARTADWLGHLQETKTKKGSGLPADLEERLEQARKVAPREPSTYRYLEELRGIACDVDARPDWKEPLDELRRTEYHRISNTVERLLVELTCRRHYHRNPPAEAVLPG